MAYRKRRIRYRYYNYNSINTNTPINNTIEKIYFVVIQDDYYNRHIWIGTNQYCSYFAKLNDAIEFAQKSLTRVNIIVTLLMRPTNTGTVSGFFSNNSNIGIVTYTTPETLPSYPFSRLPTCRNTKVCSINKKFIKKSTIERKRKNKNEKSEDVLRGQEQTSRDL